MNDGGTAHEASLSRTSAGNVVCGIGGVLDHWRRRLTRLVDSCITLSPEQRSNLKDAVLFLEMALSFLEMVPSEAYDPSDFLDYLGRRLDEDDAVSGSADARGVDAPWTELVSTCADELEQWAGLLESLRGEEPQLPPDAARELDRAISQLLRPAAAVFALVADDSEGTPDA
ncbi:MAG: hypothetical protein AAGC60_17730 [Acidobacteriota bacterium]